MSSPSLAVIIILALTIVGAIGGLFLKKGANQFNFNPFDQIRNKWLIFGALLYLLPLPIYLWALKVAPLSVIFPITSLTYVWVILLSIKMLGEKVNRTQWIGITLIILGVTLVAQSGI